MGTRTGMTVTEAVELVNEAIVDLDVGPEQVVAMNPADITVDWDARPDQPRCSKVFNVRCAVKAKLPLHRMPEVLLVAEDDVVTGIFNQGVGTWVV